MSKRSKPEPEPKPRVTFFYNEGVTMKGRAFTLSDMTKLVDEAHARGFDDDASVHISMYSRMSATSFLSEPIDDEIRISAKTEKLNLDGSSER